jgi:hypothetical protein
MYRAMGLQIVLLLFTGCAQLSDFAEDGALRWQVCASYATTHHVLQQRRFGWHYQRGWKQGHYDAARGGMALRPTVPDPIYLTLFYHSSNGRQHLDEWYQGYEAGFWSYHELSDANIEMCNSYLWFEPDRSDLGGSGSVNLTCENSSEMETSEFMPDGMLIPPVPEDYQP